eukprot:TRINITY_DN11486_c0_g1_i1.p1 TRINITY_DN11486_c0_g1~~TRINITY_DN11486_c0_g1_i1.p1  ORF type:complete len:167 (+),score=53.08 TRINITY_DN11486_c0_g1_i1:128-628(+)
MHIVIIWICRENIDQNRNKPSLPDPAFHPDDADDTAVYSTQYGNKDEQNMEDSAQVKFWCEKWRLVIGKILERDIELVSPKSSVPNSNENDVIDDDESHNKDESFAFIQLTDDEYHTLKDKCLESLDTVYGRTAFSLIINRQRNTEYGLELKKAQFIGLVQLIDLL